MTRGEGADLPSNDTPSARSAGRRFWINTVSLDHVEGAIEGGFTQADHGANTRLHRPRPGDLMVFYSPRTNLHGGIPVRQFTAGRSIGDDIDSPRFVGLAGELALSSERFRTLWARHDIRSLEGGTTTVNHPVVGELRLHRDKLPVDDVLLVLYYADQGSESDEKLRLLASMAQTRAGD